MSDEIRSIEEELDLVDNEKKIEIVLGDNHQIVVHSAPGLDILDISRMIGDTISVFADHICADKGPRTAFAYLEYIRVCQDTAMKKYKKKIVEEDKANANTEV